MKIKLYACKFCKKWTTRKEARLCVRTHIKTNKHRKRDNEKWVSPITQALLKEEV